VVKRPRWRAAREALDSVCKQVEADVRHAMVLRDERAVIPIGSYNVGFGVTLSLPSIVGRGGVVRTFEPEMPREERQALELGAADLRKSEGRG
jgi:malate/lactate dehydrogenase